MTSLCTLLAALTSSPASSIQILLPDGSLVPPSFHVTEIGLVRKDFIDCGGVKRASSACVIQVWVANDVDHRLDTTKLRKIFDLASPLFDSDELPVEVEYENSVLSQYPIVGVDVTALGLIVRLGSKHTACLATELCGIIEDRSCCGSGSSNCC
jgi:hypothetical protein